MICERCKIVMKSGTSYQQSNGKNTARRFDECQRCKTRKYNNQSNFQEIFRRAATSK